MKRTVLFFAACFASLLAFAQPAPSEKLIELGRAYKNYMFQNEPDKDLLKGLKKDMPASLAVEADFVAQTITKDNKLNREKYLVLPSEEVLKNIFIIRAINLNLRDENQIDNRRLIDSLANKPIRRYELVDNYYSMLFTGIGNKNKPFDFSKSNFQLDKLKLQDETERGIFFLVCMELCGSNIWGYMNVVKPPNTKEALSFIQRYPKFNGQPYFQYADFFFPDFEMVITTDEGPQSYKGYYLNKYYETLLSHLICLNKEGASESDRQDLLLGSILKDNKLYKYTRYKEVLEQIFEVKKRD